MTIQDRTLMKIKDIVLLVGAIAGLVAGGTKLIAMPYQNEREIIDLKKINEKMAIEVYENTKEMNTMKAQYAEIMRSLARIEKSVGR